MLHICSNPIKEKAQIGCLNYSSIFSELIHAAIVCEYFASDVFIDLQTIEKVIKEAENRVFYLGYRNSGVDGSLFVRSRLEGNRYYEYIRLYRLEISVDDGYISAELKRVSEYDAYKELIEEENYDC